MIQTSSTSSADTANVQTVLNAHPFSRYQWMIFILCFAIVLIDGFDTAAIGYIAPSLIDEWGVSKSVLGPVLSAGLFGLVAGGLTAGPLADRFGRKTVLVASVFVMGLACLVSSFAGNVESLTFWRFITGVGLGAAMPSAVTLMSEFCPESRRAMMTNALFCGFPLGSALGGFLAAWMIPTFGWRSVLVLGGIAPLLLLGLLVWLLPESVRYMLAKGHGTERIRAVLQPIAGQSVRDVQHFVMAEATAANQSQAGIGIVLSRRYGLGTAMLWIASFMGLVIFYALTNWMPVLFKEAGLDPKTATLVAALFPLGGIGAIFAGWLMDRFNATVIVAAGFAFTAVSIWWIGQAAGSIGGLVVAVFIAGILMNTSQSSMPSLAVAYYPTSGRATGVAWMLGIGRFGGIAGSFVVAEMAARGMGFSAIFSVIAMAGLIASSALIVKHWRDSKLRSVR